MGNKASNTPSIDLNTNAVSSARGKKINDNLYESKEPSTQLSVQMNHLCVSPSHIMQPSDSFTSRLSSRTPHSSSDINDTNFNCTPTRSQASFPSTPVFKHKHTRHSSFSHVCNGITGTHISTLISKIAAEFWQQNIDNLEMDKKLEVACSILFGALSTNKDVKHIMNSHLKRSNKKIEDMSLKYLDMIGWLIRYLVKQDIDLYSLLTTLGVFHQKLGVKINHFCAFLESTHETFSYYFPVTYTIDVKYAMDEIFTLSSQIMTGQDLKYSPYLTSVTKSFENENNIEFLKNLDICLKSTIGKEYFYRYLQQTFCDEIAIFLQLLAKFKAQSSDIQRFMVARDIIKSSIDPNANFTLNLSFDCRATPCNSMQELERKFVAKEPLNLDSDFFVEVEQEIYKLILQNHWNKFVNNIQLLHDQSFGKL